MCRNIKRLRHPDHPPTDEELHNAMTQVWGITRSRVQRKVSGS